MWTGKESCGSRMGVFGRYWPHSPAAENSRHSLRAGHVDDPFALTGVEVVEYETRGGVVAARFLQEIKRPTFPLRVKNWTMFWYPGHLGN